MRPGIRKGLEDIAWELKGIKNILASIWHSRYENNSTDVLNPQAFADEYISTEECSRRLGVSDQTLRNWMALGKKNPEKGWVEGIARQATGHIGHLKESDLVSQGVVWKVHVERVF